MSVEERKALTIPQVEELLRDSYRRRRDADSTDSYRALATELGVHFTTLFKVLKGERKLGFHTASEIGKNSVSMSSNRLRSGKRNFLSNASIRVLKFKRIGSRWQFSRALSSKISNPVFRG